VRDVRVSCDSVAAKGAATRNGKTLFAKNSDRPANECQPLVRVPAKDHELDRPLRCQYIEIPPVRHTYAFLGARPHWLWGLEHGVNEHGLAIGNHTIFTRDPVADTGLLGMDLVRLGLERAASAAEAVDVISTLIERHGQGGSGYIDTVWPYHNSFLIADPGAVFLLEASAGHWAVREAASAASASNHATIGADWTRLSPACEQHAREKGWWLGEAPFDFAAAYRDTSVVPPVISSGRYGATCTALTECSGRLDVSALRRLMRDHGASADVYRPGYAPDDERYYSVCMHADPVGTTTASMIVELEQGVPGPVWVAFCNPCVAPYLPVFLQGELPADLQRGDRDASSGGAWWRFKELLTLVERDWVRNAPAIREAWRGFEAEIEDACAAHSVKIRAATAAERARANTTFMHESWQQCSTRLGELASRLRSS
jgi:secernin